LPPVLLPAIPPGPVRRVSFQPGQNSNRLPLPPKYVCRTRQDDFVWHPISAATFPLLPPLFKRAAELTFDDPETVFSGINLGLSGKINA
jgi:hypothetical protein